MQEWWEVGAWKVYNSNLRRSFTTEQPVGFFRDWYDPKRITYLSHCSTPNGATARKSVRNLRAAQIMKMAFLAKLRMGQAPNQNRNTIGGKLLHDPLVPSEVPRINTYETSHGTPTTNPTVHSMIPNGFCAFRP